MSIVRVILDKDVTEANIGSVAWDLQWSLGDFTKAEGTTPKQAIFYTREMEKDGEAEEKIFIRYTEDFYIDLPYIEVCGENPSLIKLVVEDIRDCLTTYTVPEAFEMVKNAKDREELFLAIRYLGIGCGGYPMTPELLELFEKLAQDPDPEIRETTIIAMVYAGAAELEDIFEKVAQSDPHEEVRAHAARSLERLREYVINKSAS